MNPGFYKADNNQLLYAPNFVLHADFELRSNTHAEHEYPIDGWYWFETEDEARKVLGIPAPEPADTTDQPLPTGQRQGHP